MECNNSYLIRWRFIETRLSKNETFYDVITYLLSKQEPGSRTAFLSIPADIQWTFLRADQL